MEDVLGRTNQKHRNIQAEGDPQLHMSPAPALHFRIGGLGERDARIGASKIFKVHRGKSCSRSILEIGLGQSSVAL